MASSRVLGYDDWSSSNCGGTDTSLFKIQHDNGAQISNNSWGTSVTICEVVAPGTHFQGMASSYRGYAGSGVCDKYWPTGQAIFTASSDRAMPRRTSRVRHRCTPIGGSRNMV
jgi:hypothetical protein